MSRKYHPDANVNNPNKEQAEERFKQVQQAYDQIMKERQQGTSGNYGSTGRTGGSRTAQEGPFGGFSGTYYYGNNTYRSANQEQSPKMQAAINYLRNRSFEEALHVLNDIPFSERSGRWYYYSAMANAGAGNNVTAKQHIAQALAMDPNNMQYRAFEQQLNYGGDWYSNMGRSYTRPYAGGSSFCLSLCLMNILCNCCCNPVGFRF